VRREGWEGPLEDGYLFYLLGSGFFFSFSELRVIFDADTTALNAYTNESCLRLGCFSTISIYNTY